MEGSVPKLTVEASWIVGGSKPETIEKIALSPQTVGFAAASTRILQFLEVSVAVGTNTNAEPLLLALFRRVVNVPPPLVDKRTFTLPDKLVLDHFTGYVYPIAHSDGVDVTVIEAMPNVVNVRSAPRVVPAEFVATTR
jgi:hypothetical protein